MAASKTRLLLMAAFVVLGGFTESCDCGKKHASETDAGTAAKGGAGGRSGSGGRSGAGGSAGRRSAGAGGASATGGSAGAAGKAGQMAVVPPTTTLRGTVSKGPFVSGAPITVSPVDATGTPTTRKFLTRTSDDVGSYSLQFDYQGPVQIEVTGAWYDELAGQPAASELTLRALATVTAPEPQTADVSVVTHLTLARIKTLMAAGASLNEARDQAEGELRSQLAIGGSSFGPSGGGSELTGDDAAAYTLAFGNVSLLAARIKRVTTQAMLNGIQSAFGPKGTLGATWTEPFDQAEQYLEPDEVMASLAAYYTLKASPLEVPNINRAIDSDGDGIVNIADNCVLIPNATQLPVRGLCTFQRQALPTPSSLVTLPSALDTTTGDLDGDGDIDLVCGSFPRAYVFVNDGKGQLTASTIEIAMALGTTTESKTRIQPMLGDLTGDGNADLLLSVVSDMSVASLKLLPSRGNGTFDPPLTIWTSNGPDPIDVAALVDVNGDQKLDIVGTRRAASQSVSQSVVVVLLQPTEAAWTDVRTFPVGATDRYSPVRDVAIGQLTQDKKLDLLVLMEPAPNGPTPTATSGLYLMTGDGAGSFTASALTSIATGCTTSIAVADFDEDTLSDIALLDQNGTELRITFGKSDGSFGPTIKTPVVAETTLLGEYPDSVGTCPASTATGSRGIGYNYLLEAGHYSGKTHWDLAAGNSIFVSNGRAAPAQYFVRTSPTADSLSAAGATTRANADLDGDGITDIIDGFSTRVTLINPEAHRSW